MRITTTNCSRHGHTEFVLESDDSQVPPSYLQDVVAAIEAMVAQGSRFQPGQTFQIGWMLTLVEESDGGQLTLAEPDMQALPIRWTQGVTQTLRQFMVQIFALESVDLRSEMAPPSIRQSLIVCSRFTQSAFVMDRAQPYDAADSGWFVGCQDSDHNHNEPANLTRVSIYHALLRQPGIAAFAAFPAESHVAIAPGEEIRIHFRGHRLPIRPGSFLARACE